MALGQYGLGVIPRSLRIHARELSLQTHVLLGICLGFGRHNAELFQRRDDLIYPKSSIIMPKAGDGFLTVDEEIDYLWAHLKPIRKTDDCLLPVIGVAFAGDPDQSETHELAKKYDLLQKKLLSIFSKKDWLERILTQLGH